LKYVLIFLAKEVARDGEGATKLLEVHVQGATSVEDAKIAAKDLQPKAAWARDQKGKIYSVNLDAKTHQEIPGTRNYNMVPPSSLTGRITTGFFHYVDPATGNVYQVPETHTSVPVGSGRRGSAAPTPAEQQGSAAAAPAVSAAGVPSAAAQ
jgi:hypothetical protein